MNKVYMKTRSPAGLYGCRIFFRVGENICQQKHRTPRRFECRKKHTQLWIDFVWHEYVQVHFGRVNDQKVYNALAKREII